jgi:hypothetical protein
MNLDAVPKCSGKLFLRNMDDDFRAAEGEIDEEGWAWVTINYATEGDRIARESLTARRETKVSGEMNQSAQVSEIVTENVRERVELEVYLTLNGTGNLMVGDANLFDLAPVRKMKKERFKEIWRGLPPMVTDAIHLAVRLSNPEWNW